MHLKMKIRHMKKNQKKEKHHDAKEKKKHLVALPITIFDRSTLVLFFDFAKQQIESKIAVVLFILHS